MANIGDVHVNLTGDASKLNSAVTGATGRMEKLTQKIGSVGRAMTVGVTAPIGIATAALGGMILSTMKAADQMLLLSQKSGLSTKSIQELQYAGDLAGVSLETMATSSSMLTRNLVDAANGTGEAKETVKQLGLVLRDVNGEMLSQEELFNNTLDALMKMSSPTEQAAAAMELFGRGGKEMLPMLKTFPQGMADISRKAEELGLVMSKDTIMALDLLDDTLSTNLPGAFRGAGNAIMEKFLPVIRDDLIPFINDTVVPTILSMGKWIGKLAGWFAGLSSPLKVMAVGLTGLAAAAGPVLLGVSALLPIFATLATTVLPAVTGALAPVVASIMGISAPVWIAIGAVTALGLAWTYFSKDIIGGVASAIDFLVYDSFNLMVGGINSVITATNKLFGTSFGTFEERVRPAVTVGDQFAETMNGMDDGIREFASGLVFAATDMAGFVEKTEEAVTAAEGAAASLGQLVPEKTLDAGVDSSDIDEMLKNQDLQLKALPLKTKKALTASQKAWNEYFNALTPIQKLGVKSISKIGDTVGEMNFSFDSFKGTLKAVRQEFKGFFKELLKMAAKKAVMGILNALTGGTAGAGMSVLGGIGRIFGFAQGGIITEPTAMVGMRSGGLGIMAEQGPEAIVPLGGSRAAAAGGVSVTVNVAGSVGVDDIGEQLVKTLRGHGI